MMIAVVMGALGAVYKIIGAAVRLEGIQKHVTGQNLAAHTLDEKRQEKEKTFELCSSG